MRSFWILRLLFISLFILSIAPIQAQSTQPVRFRIGLNIETVNGGATLKGVDSDLQFFKTIGPVGTKDIEIREQTIAPSEIDKRTPKEKFLALLHQNTDAMKANSTIYFTYSGHGIIHPYTHEWSIPLPGSTGCFRSTQGSAYREVSANLVNKSIEAVGDSEELRKAAKEFEDRCGNYLVSFKEIDSILGSRKVIGLIDSCYSGGIIDEHAKGPALRGERYFITSSTAQQLSYDAIPGEEISTRGVETKGIEVVAVGPDSELSPPRQIYRETKNGGLLSNYLTLLVQEKGATLDLNHDGIISFAEIRKEIPKNIKLKQDVIVVDRPHQDLESNMRPIFSAGKYFRLSFVTVEGSQDPQVMSDPKEDTAIFSLHSKSLEYIGGNISRSVGSLLESITSRKPCP